MEQLLAEHVGATAHEGLGCERADGVMADLVGAVGGLAAPDCEDGGAVNAEAGLYFVEDGAMFFGEFATDFSKPGDARIIDVGLGRAREFGLTALRGSWFAGGMDEVGQ